MLGRRKRKCAVASSDLIAFLPRSRNVCCSTFPSALNTFAISFVSISETFQTLVLSVTSCPTSQSTALTLKTFDLSTTGKRSDFTPPSPASPIKTCVRSAHAGSPVVATRTHFPFVKLKNESAEKMSPIVVHLLSESKLAEGDARLHDSAPAEAFRSFASMIRCSGNFSWSTSSGCTTSSMLSDSRPFADHMGSTVNGEVGPSRTTSAGERPGITAAGATTAKGRLHAAIVPLAFVPLTRSVYQPCSSAGGTVYSSSHGCAVQTYPRITTACDGRETSHCAAGTLVLRSSETSTASAAAASPTSVAQRSVTSFPVCHGTRVDVPTHICSAVLRSHGKLSSIGSDKALLKTMCSALSNIYSTWEGRCKRWHAALAACLSLNTHRPAGPA